MIVLIKSRFDFVASPSSNSSYATSVAPVSSSDETFAFGGYFT